MSNQMPRGLQSFRARALPFPLLNAVLAKMTNPCFVGLDDGARRMCLGHLDQRHLLRSPPGARRRASDPLLNSQKIFSHRSLRHARIPILACAALQRTASAVRLAFGRYLIRGYTEK